MTKSSPPKLLRFQRKFGQQNIIRTPSELHQNSIRNPETKFVTENHRKPKLNRTPSEPHQNSIRTPSELHQNSIRSPPLKKIKFQNKECQQNSFRTPSEPHQNSIRTPPTNKIIFKNKHKCQQNSIRTPSEPHQNSIRMSSPFGILKPPKVPRTTPDGCTPEFPMTMRVLEMWPGEFGMAHHSVLIGPGEHFIAPLIDPLSINI